MGAKRDQFADQELAPFLDGRGREIPDRGLLEEPVDGVGDRGQLRLEHADSARRLPLVRDGRGGRPVTRVQAASDACPSRIRRQAATGSWTRSRQWETQRTLFSSARATVCPPAKVNGVWPSNDAWLRAAL